MSVQKSDKLSSLKRAKSKVSSLTGQHTLSTFDVKTFSEDDSKINYRQEMINLFYTSMLEGLVTSWEPIVLEEPQQIPSGYQIIESKSYQEINRFDFESGEVITVSGSHIEMGTISKEEHIAPKKSFIQSSGSKKSHSYHVSHEKTTSSRSSKDKASVAGRRKMRRKMSKKSVRSKTVTESDFKSDDSSDGEIDENDTSWMVKMYEETASIEFINGNRYEGTLYGKRFNGPGTFYWLDGTTLIGEFKDGLAIGKAKVQYNDLSRYEGDIYKGSRHGNGSIVVRGKEQIYNGEWKNGYQHGRGWTLYTPKNWYEGEWQDGLRHGVGLRQYDEKYRYFGFWCKGAKHGIGSMVWRNNDIYEGEWDSGAIDGYGEYTWNAQFDNSLSFPVRNKHRGYWKKGRMHGIGVLTFGSEGGAQLAGTWHCNKKHGEGILMCDNGIIIESEPLFVDDRPIVGDGLHKTSSKLREIFMHTNKPESSESLFSASVMKMWSQCERLHSFPSKTMLYSLDEKTLEFNRKVLDSIQMFNFQNPPSIIGKPLIQIPLLTPSKEIDLSYYLIKAKEKLEELQNSAPDFFDPDEYCIPLNNSYSSAQRTGRESVATPSTFKKYLSEEEQTPMKMDSVDSTGRRDATEEDALRKYITYNMTRLRHLYEQYASVGHYEKLNFKPIMIRLFLWQLFRDCKIHYKMSLVETDLILFDNTSSQLITQHDPFEKIYFWQFLHSLISVGWEIYKDTIVSNEIECFIIYTFEKFLEEDIFPNAGQHTGFVLFEYRDLLPLGSAYQFYLNYGEPHTVQDFLRNSCTLKHREPPEYMKTSDEIPIPDVITGRNLIILERITYILNENPELQTEPTKEPIKCRDDPFRSNLFVCRSLGAKKIFKIIESFCPLVRKDGIVAYITYPLCFLEFYEIYLSCGREILKLEKLKNDSGNVLTHRTSSKLLGASKSKKSLKKKKSTLMHVK